MTFRLLQLLFQDFLLLTFQWKLLACSQILQWLVHGTSLFPVKSKKANCWVFIHQLPSFYHLQETKVQPIFLQLVRFIWNMQAGMHQENFSKAGRLLLGYCEDLLLLQDLLLGVIKWSKSHYYKNHTRTDTVLLGPQTMYSMGIISPKRGLSLPLGKHGIANPSDQKPSHPKYSGIAF